MPKLIVTSRYLKPGSQKNLSNFVKYIATREGSVANDLNNGNAPATQKQQTLIEALVKEFPESKTSFEYNDYEMHPTQKRASILIEEILEHNADRISNRENYVEYLANRPGAVKFGAHGLFSQEDTPIDLDAVMQEVANHPGNVWTHVVSLRRDDAQRMGYDNLPAWRDLVKRQIPNIAKQSKIDLSHLKWYAAFHDKETNPHVHIIVYSTDPHEGFLTNHGIEKIRSGFANDIYADELHHLYEQQTDVRDQLKTGSGELMKQLAEELQCSSIEDAELMQLVLRLHAQLKAAKGRKVYKYLMPEVKRTVDAIFARIAQELHIQKMYDLWCELEQAKHDVYSSAKVQFPELQDNSAFQSVKNTIIKTVGAMQLHVPVIVLPEPDAEPGDELSPFDFMPPDESDVSVEINEGMPYHLKQSDEYKEACRLFYKKNHTDDEKQECLRLLTSEADKGNILALHGLGKLYASGFMGDSDAALSQEYYAKALTGFLEIEDFAPKLKAYIQYRIGKMYAYGLGTQQDDAKAFAYFLQSAKTGNRFAKYSLANCFYFGKGTAQDSAQALHWYAKAAERNMPYASYALARMYEKGEGTPPDEAKAQEYYKDALSAFMQTVKSDHADDHLLYKVGCMFRKGLGTPIDIRQAVNLFMQSAQYQNKWAEYQLGRLYLFSADGISPDREQAVEWLTRSEDHGNEYATELLQHMEQYEHQMMSSTILGMFMDVCRVLREDYDRGERKLLSQTDSKLRRMIQKKKLELGIKDEPMQSY